MLKLLLLVLPLGLDTFAVSAALGLRRLPPRERLRASLVMSCFEMAAPVAGLLLGRAVGAAIGGAAGDVAAAALVLLGLWMLRDDDGEEAEWVSAAGARTGVALLALGLSVSLDELAVGVSIGLLRLSIVAAVILIGAQAFLVAQLGLRLGARIGEAGREWSERLGAIALVALGVGLLLERLG